MKYTLILLIVAIALLAFATPDAAAEPCSAQEANIAMARTAVASAERDLRLAEKKQKNHALFDHWLGSASEDQTGINCVTCSENALSISQAEAAVRTAKAAHKAAQDARDACLSSHICDNCGNTTSSGTHKRVICGGCNVTYWSCGSSASNHRQVTCLSQIVDVMFFDAGWWGTFSVTGCGATYWECQGSSAHRILKNPTVRRACSSSSSSGSTPPATTPSGSGSGSGSGDSSNNVPCGNSRCDKGGYASSRTAHQTTCTFPTHSRPITYWSCHAASRRYHTSSPSHSQPILTCRRCGTTFVQSKNGPCRHRGRRYSSHSGG